MPITVEPEHLHDRPHWRCRVCGDPWPCQAAKAGLLAEYRAFPSLLRIYLSAQMYDALEDCIAQDRTTENLYERFLAWTRPRTTA